MDYKFAVLLLLILHLASAAELKLAGELHHGSVSVTLQNTADHEVSFALKLQLKEKIGGEWKLVETLKCSTNSSAGPLQQKDFNCSYAVPVKAGQYKIYARANIAGSTYTYKDFFFNISDSGFVPNQNKLNKANNSNSSVFEVAGKKEDVIVSIVSVPEKVKTGEKFYVILNITSSKEETLEVYSYVYEGKTCYSFYGWKGNSEKYKFTKGETKTLNLTDIVSHDAVNGTYQLKVRARETVGAGFKDHDIVKTIGVEQVPVDLFKEMPKEPKKSATDSGLPIHLLLPIFGSIPLVVIILKKIL